jgi:hypothetical protein
MAVLTIARGTATTEAAQEDGIVRRCLPQREKVSAGEIRRRDRLGGLIRESYRASA